MSTSLHQMIRIQKRNRTLEDFDKNKIVRVLCAAGLNEKDGERVAENVAQHIQKLHDSVVASTTIRDLVQAQLNEINANVANLFRWYEKTKEAPADIENL